MIEVEVSCRISRVNVAERTATVTGPFGTIELDHLPLRDVEKLVRLRASALPLRIAVGVLSLPRRVAP